MALKGVTPRISAVASLTFFLGLGAAVQRFTKEPVDLVARLGDTVSGNMSAALSRRVSCLGHCTLPTPGCQTNPFLSCLRGRLLVGVEWSFGLCVYTGHPARQPASWPK